MPRLRHFMFRQFLRRHMRSIWGPFSKLEEASERHLRGLSHWGDIWERHLRGLSHWRHIWETYIKSIMFSYFFLALPIKSVIFFTCLTILLIRNIWFSTYCKKTFQKCYVFDTWSADVSVFTTVIFWKRVLSQLHCSLS